MRWRGERICLFLGEALYFILLADVSFNKFLLFIPAQKLRILDFMGVITLSAVDKKALHPATNMLEQIYYKIQYKLTQFRTIYRNSNEPKYQLHSKR